MQPPPLSVLMPVYNGVAFLNAAIDSIRGQTFADFEFVIVNDGSTDDTAAVARGHADQDRRIVVVDQPNGGIVSALNTGLATCRGRYVARMDGDDVAEPDRFAAQAAFLDAHPDVGAVGGWATVINEAGERTGEIRLPTEPDEIDRAIGVGTYALLHPTMMIRRDCLTAAGNYDPAFRYAEDLDLLLRLREVTRLANLPRTVLKYRRRGASMSDVGGSKYPAWDAKALLAARRRGRRPITGATLARAAERVSWTALDGGDYRTAVRQAWRAVRYAPLNVSGPRAVARIGWRWVGGRAQRTVATTQPHG